MLTEEQLELPRLTSTLRAFSNITKDYYKFSDPNFEKNLIKKRRELLNNGQVQSCSLDETTLFGQNVKFFSFYQENNKQDDYATLSDEYSSSDESDLDDQLDFKFPVESSTQAQVATPSSSHLEWTNQISEEIVKIIIEMLSDKVINSNQLQNELLELLGFDKIELIEHLFKNREAILNAYRNTSENKQHVSKMAPNRNKPPGMNNTQSIIASEIIVHTESEKRIKKQIRKEEKRLMSKFGGIFIFY
jgi:hypothetical protein